MIVPIPQIPLNKRENLFASSINGDLFIQDNFLLYVYTVKFPHTTLKDKLTVTYDFELDLTKSQIHLLKMGFLIFLAQTFLSKTIDCNDDVDVQLQLQYNKIIKLLYNLRNFKEGTKIVPPIFKTDPTHYIHRVKSQNNTYTKNYKKAINLVSGGKDSAANTILLQRNDFEIINCYISGFNVTAGSAEVNACKKIYSNFNTIEITGFEKIVKKMSEINIPNEDPSLNPSLPVYTLIYARDLLSILLAIPVALQNKANYITFGAERDVWKSNIKGPYGQIPLQDTQSELTISEINKMIKLVIPHLHLFSPIAGLHEISILSWLLKNRPELVSKLSSCSHGNWCGRCWKCTRYYLIQKYTGTEIIPFRANPLYPMSEYLQKFFTNDMSHETPYYEEILFLLKNLRLHEIKLLPNSVDTSKKQDWDYYIRSEYLFRTHSAKLIPLGFKRKLNE